MVAKAKPARSRSATSTRKEAKPMDTNVATTTAEETSTERPSPPAGMTYNRKGQLVKQRKQSARTNKVFVVMQLVDTDGSDLGLSKRNVKVLKTERNSDKVLEMIDSGEYENAFYLRLDLAAK